MTSRAEPRGHRDDHDQVEQLRPLLDRQLLAASATAAESVAVASYPIIVERWLFNRSTCKSKKLLLLKIPWRDERVAAERQLRVAAERPLRSPTVAVARNPPTVLSPTVASRQPLAPIWRDERVAAERQLRVAAERPLRSVPVAAARLTRPHGSIRMAVDLTTQLERGWQMPRLQGGGGMTSDSDS